MAEEMTTEQNAQQDEAKGGANAVPKGEEPTAVEPKADDKTVPLAALTSEREKRQAMEKELAEYREAKAKAADEQAKAAGDVEAAQLERDKYKGEAAKWAEYANTKLEALTGQLDDTQKAILQELGDDVPLAKRLSVAEKLAATKPAQVGPLGGKGGGTPEAVANQVLPARFKTKAEYHQAILEGDKELAAILADADKRQILRGEVAKLD